jgi:trk system potassium uptake protein TrkH
MWKRLTLTDIRVIGHYLGNLVLFSAGLMAVPFLTAFIFHEWEPARRYLTSAGFAVMVGSALRFCRIGQHRLNRQQALIVVGLAWVVLGVFCSIPLYFSGHFATYLDAVFDGVSGLTTTGASLVVDLDHLSNADNMFRFMMHLLGGLGLIVVALSLGIFGKGGGSALFTSEGRSEHVLPNVVQTTQFILKITALVIIVATLVLTGLMMFDGMHLSRAITHALWCAISGFVTGGFTPMQQSILYYHSFSIELVLMVLMLMGSISFVIYSKLWKGTSVHLFRDIETRTTVLWLVFMTVVFTASCASSTLFSGLPALLRRGVFMIISAFSTTGFSVVTVNQMLTVFTSGAFLTLGIVMAVGSGAGSTAGGIKLFRVGIIAKSIVARIKETIAPDTARVVVSYYHVGRRIVTPEIVQEALTIFVLYVTTYAVGALVGIAHGFDATQAIFESVAMTSNGGIITGLASPGMPVTLELFYILQMWMGRLEFIALLAMIVQIVVSVLPRPGFRQRLAGAVSMPQSQPKTRSKRRQKMLDVSLVGGSVVAGGQVVAGEHVGEGVTGEGVAGGTKMTENMTAPVPPSHASGSGGEVR